jgi:hypothetical protein
MCAFVNLPDDILDFILRKTFHKNNSFCLQNVCKKFDVILNKYYIKSTQEDFLCKECHYKSYEIKYYKQCSSCDDINNYFDGCKRGRYGMYHPSYNVFSYRKCLLCKQNCKNHRAGCNYGKIKIRGMCGLCYKCLCVNINKHKCCECGLKFMSNYSGDVPFCLKCLPKNRSHVKINPAWKEIIADDIFI